MKSSKIIPTRGLSGVKPAQQGRPITVNELRALRTSTSETEWNRVCDQIKAAHGGQYPPDWYRKVLASGLARQVQSRW